MNIIFEIQSFVLETTLVGASQGSYDSSMRYNYVCFLPLVLMIGIVVSGDGYIQLVVGLAAMVLSLLLTGYGITKVVKTKSNPKTKKAYYYGTFISVVPFFWSLVILMKRINE